MFSSGIICKVIINVLVAVDQTDSVQQRDVGLAVILDDFCVLPMSPYRLMH